MKISRTCLCPGSVVRGVPGSGRVNHSIKLDLTSEMGVGVGLVQWPACEPGFKSPSSL